MITLLIMVSLTVSTVFAYDTGFSSPGAASTPGKSWTFISYSFASDNLYAIAKKSNKQLKLRNFTIPGIPGGATIDGIEVTVEGLTAGLQADVQLSSNAGSDYTAAFTTALTGTESVSTLGGPTTTWGRTWNAADFTNNNFAMKLTTTGATGNGITISVDQVQVKVYYTRQPTTLTLSPVSGSYGGTASMTAMLTLTADGSPIPSKTINFYVNSTGVNSDGSCTGTFASSASTQPDGTATLASASLSGITAGNYPYGACASFAGDGTYQATSITSALTVIGTGTTLTVAPATGSYGGAVSLSATLTMTDGGAPINGEWIDFYLFGNPVGSSKANNSGVATLSNVSLLGYDAGESNDIGASFAGNANLNPATAANTSLTINQRPLTVTAVTDGKVYNGTTSSSGIPTVTSGSLVTGDVAAFSQTFDTKDVGTGKTLTPGGGVEDGNSGQNYTYTYQTVSTGTISKALLTVTADNKTKFLGGADPSFTFQYSGLAAGDTAAVVDVAPVCGISGPHNEVGTYTISCSGGSDNNYNFSYVNGTLTVVYAHINVSINGTPYGAPGYDLAVGTSARPSYAGVDNGPVRIESPNDALIVAGLNEVWKNGGVATSSFQVMAMPSTLLSNKYVFPAYNNVTLNEQLRFGNVGNFDTTVTVTIAGNVMGSYILHPNEQKRLNYPIDNGPVVVEGSSPNVPIVASIRDAWFNGSTVDSFSQLMGLPATLLSNKYVFPAYNNVNLDDQLRFGNVGNADTTVTVTIAGQVMGTYLLHPSEQKRVNYPVDNGPVVVEGSDPNVPIIAAIRSAWFNGSVVESWVQLMGLPASQVSHKYLFPAYDNVAVNGQLRFGNIGNADTTVTVTIGGQVQGSYLLHPSEQKRVDYPLDNGPVVVEGSDPNVPIIASLRDALFVNGLVESFAQVMGLPASQLSDTFVLPAYNNVNLSEELRFGVP